jgi:uncharacterized protein (DUF362 family)
MKTRNKSRPVRVCITQSIGSGVFALFEKALADGGFWDDLERERLARQLSAELVRIVIKPDLDLYDPAIPDGTDPALVEHLVDLLHDRGFTSVTVLEGRNEADAWLLNRDPLVVPELAGYRFLTSKGRSYEILDAQAALPGTEPAGGAVALCTHWLDAHYRINFAKNRTHEQQAYALCVYNLLGLAGRSSTRSASDDSLVVLRKAPPHFNIIDAYRSCHGRAGHRAPHPIDTQAFVTSTDALLADWAGAAKMGLDPYSSAVNATALHHVGLPRGHEVDGDLRPYPLWRNVHPLIAHSARLRAGSEGLGPLSAAWFQSVDRERFPFRDFYSDRINSFVSPLVSRLEQDGRSFLGVVLLNYAIAWIGLAVEAQHTMFAKNRVRRRIAPLRLHAASLRRGDFESIPGYLDPYARLLADFPANKAGLRWRHIEDSVVFSCSHDFPIAFERFVENVDISRSIQYMNDNIGGSSAVLRRDASGRVIHQAERNLYLPQPNWLVLFGGEVIDVEKIELIAYRKREHTICWRTIGSPNDSAIHDDGSVSFLKTAAGRTTVRIFARQKFKVPLLFKVLDVNLAPEIRDSIIESAYANFFSGTVANLQSAYEGREFRIGRDDAKLEVPSPLSIGGVSRHMATAAAAVAEGFRSRNDAVALGEWLFGPSRNFPPREGMPEVDSNGFRHFRGCPSNGTGGQRDSELAAVAGIAALMRDAPDFVTGLADAIRKDLDLAARPSPSDGTA